MLGKILMLLAYWYFLKFGNLKIKMKRNMLEKVAYIFNVVGIVAWAIWGVTSAVKEIASIPFTEWAENGVFEHIQKLTQGIILSSCGLFIIWILHSYAMFMLHKLWPDVYDERGHMRKPKIKEE